MPEPASIELILHEKVQQLLDNFATVMKISAVFFTADGRLLRRGGRDKGNCAYCDRLQKKYFSLGKCVALDNRKQEASRKTLSWQCYRCHGGLNEVLAPVLANGKLLGFILFGQFRTTTVLPPALRRRCAAPDELAELERMFLNLPYFEKNDLQNLLGLLELMVDYIVSHELITQRGDAMYDAILAYIAHNYAGNPTVGALARHLGKSVSGVSHFLKKHHAESFKTLLIRRRIAEAETLMRLHPDWPLKNISAAVGIDDHYYFSRIYRKYRNTTPGAYRKALS